jgi:predicted nucleic acid-binding protein
VNDVEVTDVAVAARLCLVDAPPLRTGDLLHIALCVGQKCRLASHDKGLCSAAAHLRIAVERLQIEI